MEYKAKFVKRLKGGYNHITKRKNNDILVYKYRGHEYDIEDIPPYQQEAWYFQNVHREEQSRIDRLIEDEEQRKNANTERISFDEQWNEIWEMLGWNE